MSLRKKFPFEEELLSSDEEEIPVAPSRSASSQPQEEKKEAEAHYHPSGEPLPRFTAVNQLSAVVAKILDQLNFEYDQRFLDSPSSRELLLAQFNFSLLLDLITREFAKTGLDLQLIHQTKKLLEKIIGGPGQARFTSTELQVQVRELLKQVNTLRMKIEMEFLTDRVAQQKAILANTQVIWLSESFYTQHFEFCVTALPFLASKQFNQLGQHALTYADSPQLDPTVQRSKKQIWVTREFLKGQMSRVLHKKGMSYFQDYQFQMGVDFFFHTMTAANACDREQLLNYILDLQQPVAQAPKSLLARLNMNAGSGASSSSSSSSRSSALPPEASEVNSSASLADQPRSPRSP